VRIARPILLVTTPIGVLFGLREAHRLAGPRMALLMALMVAVVGAFLWMTVRRVRAEAAAGRAVTRDAGGDPPR
jgi:lysozyme family protein